MKTRRDVGIMAECGTSVMSEFNGGFYGRAEGGVRMTRGTVLSFILVWIVYREWHVYGLWFSLFIDYLNEAGL